MLTRLKRLFTSEEDAEDGLICLPLCRLRHATLHPGSFLWTPGVGGGAFGEGASSVLEAAGVGGEVIVAFQAAARAPLHPHAIVARIDEVTDLPEDWDPADLGAKQRFRLTGLERITLDLATCTTKKLPTIKGKHANTRQEDLEMPSETLREALAALSKVDNNWPAHWQAAFAQLPEAPLGQWATTLGWRLSKDERLELFDHPERIETAVASTLDALHLGLDPDSRREAIRRQTVTRRTSAMPEREVVTEADTAGWAIFHPGDLTPPEGTADDAPPIPTATHLALGNLVAVRVASARMIRVRLTAKELDTFEQAAVRASASFRLYVRHGRLFVGGLNLACSERANDHEAFAEPKRWVDVPNGLYRAEVFALEPGPESERHGLADYVVKLHVAESLDEVASQEKPLEL